MPKVIWFEIRADDPERAMKFYGKTFGWKFERFGDMEYWVAKAGPEEHGIEGAIQPRTKDGQPVVNTIYVPDVDEAIGKIERNGGKIVQPKTEVPKAGTIAFFLDTEGNMHGIIHPHMPEE